MDRAVDLVSEGLEGLVSLSDDPVEADGGVYVLENSE